MKKFFFIVGLWALSGLLAILPVSCEKTLDGGYAIVTGIVRDSVTKAPLAGAWFNITDTLSGVNFYSDSLGNYKWPSRGYINITLFVGKEGYRTKWRFFPSVSGEMKGVDFELAPQ